ncbi:MAG: dihydropteroate synthase, partial [Spirochaetota bacterium]
MQTILKSQSQEVRIDTNGPVTIIGEKINPTGHKKLAVALKERDFDYIRELAVKQVEAGAHVLDVNVGTPGVDEVTMLPEIVKMMAACTQAPLCLDSNNSA